MSKHARHGIALLATLLASTCGAWDYYPHDPLHVDGRISTSPAKDMLADRPCALGPIAGTLDLAAAAERALCANPKTRTAWANVKLQAAQLGSAEAAYLPTLNGQAIAARDRATTKVPYIPLFDSDNRVRYRSQTVSLSWLLYDFGARSAADEQARQLLDAAQASQDVALQTVLMTVAKDYFTTIAAQATVDATGEIEHAAQGSLTAATARVKGGVAPVTDQLQAQTAYAQAVYNNAKARGELKTALGTLALDMGESPATPLQLAAPADTGKPGSATDETITQLLQTAQHNHPSLVSARAQLEAARAKAAQVRAQGLPTLTLQSHLSHNDQPVSPGIGSPDVPAIGRDRYIGVELDVPFFGGFGRTYQIRQAEAQVDVQQATVADAEQQVAQEVWRSYQALQTDVENVRNSETLLDSARQSFAAAQHRYERGVGNILELLNAQTALANAQQQRVQAVTDWRIGKLELVASVGRLTVAGEAQ